MMWLAMDECLKRVGILFPVCTSHDRQIRNSSSKFSDHCRDSHCVQQILDRLLMLRASWLKLDRIWSWSCGEDWWRRHDCGRVGWGPGITTCHREPCLFLFHQKVWIITGARSRFDFCCLPRFASQSDLLEVHWLPEASSLLPWLARDVQKVSGSCD